MKKICYSFFVMIIILLSGCNKDEEIIGNIPDGFPQQNIGYIVMEYTPAPGQYINENVSGFSEIFTLDEACKQAQKRLSENKYVSLGGWGGFIVIKFNEPVKNSGNYDFAIGCNAFDTSNEPGIVWVMKDSNKNGLPDDNWYELKGSDFGKEGYERNYWVTYFRPEPNKATKWEDSNGETGVIDWLGNYHSQEFYYPNWVKEDSYTLYGSRLPQQVYRDPETGEWSNIPFDWGYADNFGLDFWESNFTNRFKISDAVTEENQPANLDTIDFVKVQTAINGSAGWLGENSTEITGFFIL